MKKNPVIPYALIAVIGIVLVIVISQAGIHQRKAIESEDNGEKAEQQDKDKDKDEGDKADADPEDIFKDNCATCHASDLSGDMGPDLRKIGGKLSKDEIKDTAMNGKGQMPPDVVDEDQAKVLADWLSKKK